MPIIFCCPTCHSRTYELSVHSPKMIEIMFACGRQVFVRLSTGVPYVGTQCNNGFHSEETHHGKQENSHKNKKINDCFEETYG